MGRMNTITGMKYRPETLRKWELEEISREDGDTLRRLIQETGLDPKSLIPLCSSNPEEDSWIQCHLRKFLRKDGQDSTLPVGVYGHIHAAIRCQYIQLEPDEIQMIHDIPHAERRGIICAIRKGETHVEKSFARILDGETNLIRHDVWQRFLGNLPENRSRPVPGAKSKKPGSARHEKAATISFSGEIKDKLLSAMMELGVGTRYLMRFIEGDPPKGWRNRMEDFIRGKSSVVRNGDVALAFKACQRIKDKLGDQKPTVLRTGYTHITPNEVAALRESLEKTGLSRPAIAARLGTPATKKMLDNLFNGASRSVREKDFQAVLALCTRLNGNGSSEYSEETPKNQKKVLTLQAK